MSDYLDPENEELLKDFFIEAEQQVESMERNILAIEGNPRDHDSIDELFRAVHTLKGGAYTVQMEELGQFTHKVEDLLDEVRSDKLEVTARLVDLLLESIDVIKAMFEKRMDKMIYAEDTGNLEKQLKEIAEGTAQEAAPKVTEELGQKADEVTDEALSDAQGKDKDIGQTAIGEAPIVSVTSLEAAAENKPELGATLDGPEHQTENQAENQIENREAESRSQSEGERSPEVAEQAAAQAIAAEVGAVQEVASQEAASGFATASDAAPAVAAADTASAVADMGTAKLSRAEYADLCQQVSEPIYRVRARFDESNPMNTIGGVQEFARLKDMGTIWLTHPDFEEIYEDNFFEYIDFYLESSKDMADILQYAMLPDVTLDVEIELLRDDMAERESHEEIQAEVQAETLQQTSPETSFNEAAQASTSPELSNSDNRNSENPNSESPNTENASAALSEESVEPEQAKSETEAQAIQEVQDKKEEPEKASGEEISREETNGEVTSGEVTSGEVTSREKTDPEKASLEKIGTGRRGLKREGSASILRVDSRRVDEILNLVSEAVINKASFNQVSGYLNDVANDARLTHLAVRDKLNGMIEEFLLTASEQDLQNTNDGQKDRALRSARKRLQEQAAQIHGLFDPLENQLKNIVSHFGNSSSNLARNTNDLHEAILSMRMVPISQVFSRFPRLVRDLSRSLGKKVELVLEGEETEIDKSVAEELVDPLMHCVRNSMDHGIEDQEQRTSAGKPEEGTLRLSAVNEGSNVIIEVSDDGGGIDVQRVRQKAQSNGVIEEGQALSDQEAFNLIFDPGFSTAAAVTNISGRGVGLDVVKKQIEKLNGTVNVWSEPGVGSKFSIRLPLTLAIIQGLLVRVHSEIYAIPITAVIESIRIAPEDIQLIDNYEVIRVRDEVISLLRLNRIFQLEEKAEVDAEVEDSDRYMFVVVVGTEERQVGLMVDKLIGEEDVVIKPLVDRYTHSPGVAGATILGDGTVSLILDVTQLLDLAIQFERHMREQKAREQKAREQKRGA